MTKLDYLKRTKQFMKKVVDYRKYLQRTGNGHLNNDFVRTEMANIDYALPKLVSYDQVCKYIERKESALRMLIPSNKKRWFTELSEIRERQLN